MQSLDALFTFADNPPVAPACRTHARSAIVLSIQSLARRYSNIVLEAYDLFYADFASFERCIFVNRFLRTFQVKRVLSSVGWVV